MNQQCISQQCLKSEQRFSSLALVVMLLAGSITKICSQEVNNTNDSGSGSLRDVIASASSGATITFAPSLSGQTIVLTTGPIIVNKNITINAVGKNIAVDGNANGRILNLQPGSSTTISGLNLTNGYAAGTHPNGNGGAIFLDQAVLHISEMVASGNSADSSGGVIYSIGGTLTLNDCTFSNNSAPAGSVIGTGSVNLTVNNSIFSGNRSGYGVIGYGGAIMTFNNSTFTDNYNSGGEGVITFTQGGTDKQIFNNCTIVGNYSKEAAIPRSCLLYCEDGSITLNNSIVTQNIPNTIRAALGVSKIGNNLTEGDPLLAPLGYYGGPTQTMPPLPGSRVIEAGMNATLPADVLDLDGDTDTSEPLPQDQRGSPRIVGTNVDIGAVEAFGLHTSENIADTDTDGIDDRIETGIFGDLDSAGTATDHDGDGSTDKDEIANMTNPLDSTDYFRVISFLPTAGFDPQNPSFDLLLATFPGLCYHLQSSNNLTTPFTAIANSETTATGFTTLITVETSGDRLFIRAARD